GGGRHARQAQRERAAEDRPADGGTGTRDAGARGIRARGAADQGEQFVGAGGFRGGQREVGGRVVVAQLGVDRAHALAPCLSSGIWSAPGLVSSTFSARSGPG